MDRIILSRPAVEAGERLGFLPGDLREKVDPYLRPMYDALFDLMDARIVERAMQTNEIEIAPLAFMRGRTLSNAVVILDEAQNTTAMQMKMFLTRLGENSRMIVTGDPSQVDLPPGQTSGLAEATRLLENVEGIGTRRSPPKTSSATSWWRGSSPPTTRPTRRAGAGPRIEAKIEPAPPQTLAPPAAQGGTGPRQDRDRRPLGALAKAAATPNPSSKKRFWPPPKPSQRRAAELAIVLGDDSAIRALNRDWRGKNAPTNVLSFPAARAGQRRRPAVPIYR